MTKIWLVVLSLASNILALALPLALIQVYDRILTNHAVGSAVALFSAVLVAIVFDGLIRFVRTAIFARLGAVAEYRLSMQTAAQVLSLDRTQLRGLGAGKIGELFEAVGRSRDVLVGQSVLAMFDAPFAILFLALIWFLGGPVILAPLGVVAVLGVAALLSSAEHRTAARKAFEASAAHRRLVRVAARESDYYRSRAIAGNLAASLRRSEIAKAAATEASETAASRLIDLTQIGGLASTVAILFLGAQSVLDGAMTTGGLAACMIFGQRAVGGILGMISNLARRRVAAGAYAELRRLFRERPAGRVPAEPSEAERGPPVGLSAEIDGARLTVSPGEIVVVSAATRDVEARLFRAMVDAVVYGEGSGRGASGPGLVRLDADAAGAVVAVPPMPPVLIGTVMENMTNFDPRRSEEALRLAEALGVQQALARLPDGYQTKLGVDFGLPLSDGVVKRIGLVRGLSAMPRLVVLGWPTAALDKDGEDRLVRVLKGQSASTTIVAFDRAPSLRAIASRVVTIADGRAQETEIAA